ncbi:MAG: type I secretion system permease/ATPase, partial [Gammaproteobacteria bacterium]|nr:type I secretion system permease/ATPase [Gammaproteobacteria bacterium]
MAQTHNREDHHDTGLECLVLVARLHGLAAEVDRLRHEFSVAGRSLDSDTLVRAARYLGLKAKKICSNQQRLARTALPVIARHRDGHYFIIARVNEGKMLLRDPLRPDVQSLPVSELAGLWSGELVLITRRAQQAAAAGHFGFGWFVAAMLRYRSLLAEVLVASFFIQLLALVTPLFFQVVIDKVLVHQGLSTLDVLAAGLLVVSVFEVTLGGLRTYVFSHTTNRIDVELGGRLYRHLLALPLAYFESRRVGDSVARVRELENIRNFITGAALTVVVDLVFTVVFLAVMYFYSPLLTLVVLATFPAYLLLSILVTPVLRARLQEKFNRGAENQAFLVETLSGMETLKASAVEPQSRRRWEEQLAAYVQASFRSANLGNIAGQSAGLINKFMTIMILWCGAHAVISGELSVGQLIAFNMFAARVSAPVLRLVQLWQDFQQASVSVRRLGDILNTPTEPVYDRNRTALPGLKGRIQFDNVSFSYQPQGREILRQLSLDISPGQVVGIVGRSGSGKSTLARLVQRLHVPDSGRVRVDGVDLAMVDVTWLRHQIGVVLQENILFNRTIRENIALRDPGMPLEQVIRAARLAGAHNFILELSEGYDTLVGEQGSNLSGGQRQRIAIARALVTNPRILIFDEATSALDYESEQAVQENMAAITRGRTVIIIAHRLSALRHVDRVVVIDQGRIVEQGGHESLLK